MSATDFVYDVHMVFIGFLGCSLCGSDVHWTVEHFLGIRFIVGSSVCERMLNVAAISSNISFSGFRLLVYGVC